MGSEAWHLILSVSLRLAQVAEGEQMERGNGLSINSHTCSKLEINDHLL